MNAIIIEDESLIARELQHKIETVAPDIKIIQILPSVKTGFKWFMENAEPALIFADIQLGDGVSFEIFERFNFSCPVIFTTAYDEYAIRAFKVNGVDYLLKPIDEEELQKAINKARTIIASTIPYPKDIQALLHMLAQPANTMPVYKEKFIVKQRKNWVPIYTNDIACFYRDQLNYILTFNGDKYVLDFVTLDEIEELVDPKIFYRANRQCIVHINAIQTLRPEQNQKIVISLRDPLKMQQDISREKAPGFKKWFER